MDVLWLMYTLLCTVAVVQCTLMLMHAWEHSRFHSNRLFAPLDNGAEPRTVLFAPLKGLDHSQETNLRALFEQRHSNFEICFIVESADEPVLPLIARISGEYVHVHCRVVVAGQAATTGQKVHNLMIAAGTIDDDVEVLAFVDSDACPPPFWLSRLTDQLRSGKHAVITGYRWYVPQTSSLTNLVLASMNAVLTGLMSSHGMNLVWGGAWAIRTSTFRQLGLPGAWAGCSCDDLSVSRLVRQAGLTIGYDPNCLVTSPADMSPADARNFVRRQYLLARVYVPLWWWGALLATTFELTMLLSSAVLVVIFTLAGEPGVFPLLAGCGYYLLTASRGVIAGTAVRPFVRASGKEYGWVSRMSVWGWPIVVAGHWCGLMSTLVGRRMTWRGIRYRLDGPQQTVVLGRRLEPPATVEEPVEPCPVREPAPASRAA